MFKKTKIVATIGPVTENEEMITKMVKAGLNVARLNFSHGDWAEHQNKFDIVRKVAEKLQTPIAILQDLAGPKIRIGDFSSGSVVLKTGKQFILSVKECVGDENKVFVNYKNLTKELKIGSFILLNDGRNKLQVKKIKGDEIFCQVVVGGEIKGRRGVNLPGAYLKISSLTEKDKKDIDFGVKNKPDFMALSFVRKVSDVLELRAILEKKGIGDIKIISKIETAEAIENIDEIIATTDGIMVARGDLAVEMPAEEVPILQKMIIEKCNGAGKPVITATQMLESMIKNPVPTRAEVSDVANAILDGTDAIMLSEETTLGLFPLEAVEIMVKIALHTEKNFDYEKTLTRRHLAKKEIADSISYAIVNVAHNIEAKVIVALTESSFTARIISRYKPEQMIVALTPNKKTYNTLALSFGCYPQLIEKFENIEEVSVAAIKIVLRKNFAKNRDKIVIAAGVPFGKKATTSLLLVKKV